MLKPITLACMLLVPITFFGQTAIGITSYDVQTNNGAKHRIHVNPDGTISAAWTGSMDYTGALTFADRGMFYNHYAGGLWGAWPAARVEPVKTGFGELIRVDDHEVMLSHDGVLGIQLFANATIGGTSFTELAGSDDIPGFWPSAYCPNGTNDLYVINANANPPTELRFSRSDDGGVTWSVLNSVLPFLTIADGFPGLSSGLYQGAETYQIAVYGTDVYVLVGMVNSDLLLLHSPSNGAIGTWTSTVLVDNPLVAWNGLTQTDTNGDFVTDVIETTDGYYNMFIDDAGTVHVFAGYVKVFNDGIGAFWSYNWQDAQKMWYWHSGMGAASLIDLTLDWDNTDGLGDPVAGIGAFRSHYRNPGLTSMPGACVDNATGKIYLLYTMPIEYTDDFGDPTNLSAQSRRDIFGVASEDGGVTWSAPVNMTNSAEAGKENVYPSVYARYELARIHMVWQEDLLPGTAITDFDVVDTNYIMYRPLIDPDFGVVEVCNAATGPVGLGVTDLTATSATLTWDAVDLADQYVVIFWNTALPANIGRQRPTTNEYVMEAGVLEPGNTYAFRVKTVCYEEGEVSPSSDTYFFTTPLRAGELQHQIQVYPNPSAGLVNLNLSNLSQQDITISVMNSVGALIQSEQLTITDSGLVHTLDLQDVPSGLYYVMISGNSISEVKSIVIE